MEKLGKPVKLSRWWQRAPHGRAGNKFRARFWRFRSNKQKEKEREKKKRLVLNKSTFFKIPCANRIVKVTGLQLSNSGMSLRIKPGQVRKCLLDLNPSLSIAVSMFKLFQNIEYHFVLQFYSFVPRSAMSCKMQVSCTTYLHKYFLHFLPRFPNLISSLNADLLPIRIMSPLNEEKSVIV